MCVCVYVCMCACACVRTFGKKEEVIRIREELIKMVNYSG